MPITITTERISRAPWGGVDKPALQNRLGAALEQGVGGAREAIREVYAAIRGESLSDAPSTNWFAPHHELLDDSVVLNRGGLIAAAAALSGARAEPDLTPDQLRSAARHLLRHYRERGEELGLDPPPALLRAAGESRTDADEAASELRFDFAELRADKRQTGDGFLRVTADVTRPGVFPYLRRDGSTRWEFRPPAEVHRADSLESLKSIAVVDSHPYRRGGLVHKDNADELTVGWTGENVQVRADGVVSIPVTIAMADTIAKIRAGKQGVSCGYGITRFDATPGDYKGKHYDGVQIGIQHNHLAIERRGRLGADMRLRLDGADEIETPYGVRLDKDEFDAASKNPGTRHDKKGKGMAKIVIDGVEYQDVEASIAGVVKAELNRRDGAEAALKAELETMKGERDTQQGRADAAIEENTKLKAEPPRLDADQLHAAVTSRVALLSTVKALVDDDEFSTRLDTMKTELEVKRAFVEKVTTATTADFEGKADGYIEARFDGAVEAEKERAEARAATDATLANGLRSDAAGAGESLEAAFANSEKYYATGATSADTAAAAAKN